MFKLFILAVCLTVTLGLESMIESRIFREIKTYHSLGHHIHGSDFLNVVYIYTSNRCNKCSFIEPIIVGIGHEFEGIVKFLYMDCNILWEEVENRKNIPICDPEMAKEMPQLMFYIPNPKGIDETTGKILNPIANLYKGEATKEALRKEIKSKMPNYVKVLESKEDLQKILFTDTIPFKFLYFTDKTEIPAALKGLSSHFRDRLEIAVVFKNSTNEFEDYFRITEFPKFVLINPKSKDLNFTGTYYEGKIEFESIRNFLEEYSLKRKILQVSQEEDRKKRGSPMVYNLTAENYEQMFSLKKMCMVHIKKKGEGIALFEELKENLGYLFIFYEFNVNSKADEKFLEAKLNIKHFPTLKIIPLGDELKRKSSRLEFPNVKSHLQLSRMLYEHTPDFTINLNEDNINNFFEKSLNGVNTPVILFCNEELHREEMFYFKSFVYEAKTFDSLLKFGIFFDPSEQVKKQLDLVEFPAIFALVPNKNSDPTVMHMKQNITSENLFNFIYEVNARTLAKINPEDVLPEIQTQEQFENDCLKKAKICFIFLINGKEVNYVNLEILQKIFQRF